MTGAAHGGGLWALGAFVVAGGLWLASAAGAAESSAGAFDGKWSVTLDCPTHKTEKDFARAYKQTFAGEVMGGQFRATHGSEGEPGWHLLHGPIAADGKAMLRLDGIVNSERHSINDAQRGKPYSYRVRAQFEPTRGTGERMGTRKCDFIFTRQ